MASVSNGANLAAAVGGSVAEQLSGACRAAGVQAARRVQRFLTRSGEVVQRSPEELIAIARDEERKLDLLMRALEAASQSATEIRIDTLATAFAFGVIAEDDAVVEEHILVIDTLAQLEVVHLRLLAVLVDQARDAARIKQIGFSEKAAEELRYAWTRDEVLAREPGLTRAYDALIAKVQALGLIRDEGLGRLVGELGYTPYWQLTEFGRLCVRALVERGQGATGSDIR